MAIVIVMILFVDVATQPKINFIPEQNFVVKLRTKRNIVLDPWPLMLVP